ncbi:DoxX family protein [Luteimonas sp. SX5]|uniref:DoxX family protein n=1 Tax=Luteimonas galliterrae TaxID=2940486 RepID=A0ABT0MK72_9GAMM|nr:DoxX family protein [Luteimonas galliterrae]MCL1635277.1 DoxX family protein [Luteimonas galliterrae]
MNPAAQQDLGKLVLRVVLGALILLHGIAKIRSGLGPIEGMLQAHGLPHYLAYGALVGEVLAPLLLILGWYARIGAALVLVNMVFAFALAHMGQVTQLNDQGGWALELQGMFLASSLALLLLGPGKYSVNQR